MSSIEPVTPVASKRMVRIAKELLELGVVSSQVTRLLASYSLDQIEQQLRWLPFRKARNKASFIVTAIDNDYERPLTLS